MISLGKTITEKILARASGKKSVAPGDYVMAKPDLVVFCEMLFPLYKKYLKELGVPIHDPEKVMAVIDHTIPIASQPAGYPEVHKEMRKYVKEQKIKWFFDVGRHGISHNVAIEEGLITPGMFAYGDEPNMGEWGSLGALGAGDSSDAYMPLAIGEIWFRVPESLRMDIVGTFKKGVRPRDLIQKIAGDLGPGGANLKAIEYTGPTIDRTSVEDRMTVCNLVRSCGAITAITTPNQKVIEYVKGRTCTPFSIVESDHNAEYEEVYQYNVSKLEPQVAAPPTPTNTKSVQDVEGIDIEVAWIGSCANGGIESLRAAARILKGRTVHPQVRAMVIPATQKTYLQALKEGLLEIFVKSHVLVCAPTCGPCFGYTCALAAHERCICTGTTNVQGRMGSPAAEIYLASEYTVAASAVEGEISDPRKFLE